MSQTKTKHLQLRVNDQQKRAIKQAAKKAGLGMSAWVLNQCFPPARQSFRARVRQLGRSTNTTFDLNELGQFLLSLTPGDFQESVSEAPLNELTPFLKNYVAAMVEQRAFELGRTSPRWTTEVFPLTEPLFVSDLKSLRPHLLKNTPVVFRRRNIFVDTIFSDRM